MKEKCNCISNSRPSLGGTELALVIQNPFSPTLKTVCIDSCIAPIIQELWDAGVETGGSCCGHNGKISLFKSVVISNKKQAVLAKRIVGERMEVLFWDLVEQEMI